MENHDLALKAANWWADAFINPKFRAGADAYSPGLIIAQIMASENADKNVSDYTKQRFIDALVDIIEPNLDKYDSVSISVDYDPDKTLYTACEMSGMPKRNAPWKTNMVIRPKRNAILVSIGYGDSLSPI